MWLDLLKQYGLSAGTIGYVIVAGSKKDPVWIFGVYHRETVASLKSVIAERDVTIAEIKKDANEWKRLYLALLPVTKQAVEEVIASKNVAGKIKEH